MNKFIVINVRNLIITLTLVIILISICFTGNFLINETIETISKKKLLPIYSVETEKNAVALTFDCAWGADDISKIIETLESNKIKATFFAVGDWAKKYPEAVKVLDESGMEIRESFL